VLLQESKVQALLSLQLTGAIVQVLSVQVAGLQTSVHLQATELQEIQLPGTTVLTQVPAEQESVVQGLLSSQFFGVNTQPDPEEQVSIVQASLSLQTIGVKEHCPFAGVHVSLVQALSSSQTTGTVTLQAPLLTSHSTG
jgi:hypothetical protein